VIICADLNLTLKGWFEYFKPREIIMGSISKWGLQRAEADQSISIWCTLPRFTPAEGLKRA
jgi:hypothetical protein